MRNFLNIAEGIDVTPMLDALAAHPELWNQNDLRTTHPQSPHTAVDDIWLRFNRLGVSAADTIDDIQTYPYPAWDILHPVRDMVLNLMRRVGGTQLGRVIITRLPAGAVITPHEDHGAPVTFYRRYQIILQSLQGSIFTCGGEQLQMRSGEAWWIDNKQTHSVTNNSADDRIVIITDICTC
ncbi:aspartyl/asparaginyl beta-hydroxylase domain-containing protein [Sphingobium phenoxybenzoativorans]|uniref:aspartyl/asparaginyl beta-hydroxylase domain-containing protein n=1 Tax=Sphingobium phenoxybenzoativorans TaxID=1592790 RepID=UPI000871CF71|nr:aspartyl/asparaginyl beta-hydroxylase domain-containing protein [Sphingobium phenoxybenzoativorans]